MVNIMIVEDEKPISNLIALSLKKVGYHCECAYDGLSAIDMIEKKYPDLILICKTIRYTSDLSHSERRIV